MPSFPVQRVTTVTGITPYPRTRLTRGCCFFSYGRVFRRVITNLLCPRQHGNLSVPGCWVRRIRIGVKTDIFEPVKLQKNSRNNGRKMAFNHVGAASLSYKLSIGTIKCIP